MYTHKCMQLEHFQTSVENRSEFLLHYSCVYLILVNAGEGKLKSNICNVNEDVLDVADHSHCRTGSKRQLLLLLLLAPGELELAMISIADIKVAGLNQHIELICVKQTDP